MPHLQVNGEAVEVSEAGWLEDCRVWNEEIAKAIAQAEGVTLTDEHWDVIREARAYFEEYGLVAEQRIFMKLMKEKFGPDRATQQYLYQLFPHGPLKQGNKIAGLPRPKGCS
ncbi:TusE/DsrC/DsvC family sulfur relay protein [Magnetospirillum gryphiswaldense]|uniref:Subunit of enzyme for 2-thio modification of mnm5s2U of tRNA anticodon U n=2 Tax=Magnetospirillum gryphiswaldense TaxID=55518 RepID=V6F4A3_MAGGM|nr:TusE/DsrC/DsvC family sulfur relay protein [Magnetospirillum gryphiswaldense]AVM75823.1 Sulfurtransferase TusE [Magnetospirillum gryphiswaldense MSR-1]AVM79726.1 Sulfurtransferase TusE [Magnetospirillum gryphiswaldense]CAM77304.1 DsrC-like protein [Magnetospirillum gryphiswaldense MSR-1]CDL00227.1 subunit of enzyme for 2-thio modification of mnm5s2U of tRNA anticodon U [Magnetospirillum gryphiswaldense MSR-1 v2]